MLGHATGAEEAAARKLEKKYRSGTASATELLELACYLMEPMHQEDEALAVLRLLLQAGGDYWEAKVWIAYLSLHYLMDKSSLEASRRLLEGIAENGESHAAALLLTAQLGEAAEALGPAEVVAFLERSVAAAPHWVCNRQLLAIALSGVGRADAADEQLAAAERNVVEPNPAWSHCRQLFEVSITGRTSFGIGPRLHELRTRLRAARF